MTLEEHAHVIEAAIQAAAEDGFELDNGHGDPARIELNEVRDGILCVVPSAIPIVTPHTYAY